VLVRWLMSPPKRNLGGHPMVWLFGMACTARGSIQTLGGCTGLARRRGEDPIRSVSGGACAVAPLDRSLFLFSFLGGDRMAVFFVFFWLFF
jgi:hypothetical protein